MSDKPRQQPTLVDQQVALGAYLDSLLREVGTAPPAEAPAPVHQLRPSVVQAQGATDVSAPTPPVDDEKQSRPAWGEAPFQSLLFSVGGLTLAVPLDKLNGIAEWDAAITRLPERPPWFLGVTRYRERQAGVVDTAGVVMPERAAAASPRYSHIIYFDDGRWGLACEAVREVVTLAPDQVRWRSSRTRRPWLAGTVIDQMCALLDIDALGRMIAGGG